MPVSTKVEICSFRSASEAAVAYSACVPMKDQTTNRPHPGVPGKITGHAQCQDAQIELAMCTRSDRTGLINRCIVYWLVPRCKAAAVLDPNLQLLMITNDRVCTKELDEPVERRVELMQPGCATSLDPA